MTNFNTEKVISNVEYTGKGDAKASKIDCVIVLSLFFRVNTIIIITSSLL